MYSRAEILELSKRIGRSRSCLRRWVAEGCDLRNHASAQAWMEKNKLRETNVAKARRRRGLDQKGVPQIQSQTGNAFKIPGNGELPPAGKTGAGHTLRRLEEEEQRAYARMQVALERGNPIEIR